MYIGKRIQEILSREKISMAAISEETNIPLEDMEAFIKGKKIPTLEQFVRIVNALHVSPNEILGGGSGLHEDLLSYERKFQNLSQEKQEQMLNDIEIFLDKKHN